MWLKYSKYWANILFLIVLTNVIPKYEFEISILWEYIFNFDTSIYATDFQINMKHRQRPLLVLKKYLFKNIQIIFILYICTSKKYLKQCYLQ